MLRETNVRKAPVRYLKKDKDDGSTAASNTIGTNSAFKDSGIGSSLSDSKAPNNVRYATSMASLSSSIDQGIAPKIPSLSEEAKRGMLFECDACAQLITVRSRTQWK